MKQRASTITALSFVFCPRLWLSLALMLGLFTIAQAHAGYVPDQNHNPVWTGADAEPAEGPDWNDDEGDSVPNWLEEYHGTLTWQADTDSDGLSDWDEIFSIGTNPALWDTDGNGLSDADDLIQPPDAGDMGPSSSNTDNNGSTPGSDPTSDADADGLPDIWELANGLNPYDLGDIADDPDGDFIFNIEEYQHGTNPQVGDDFWTVMGYPIDTSMLHRQDDGTERDADWDGDGVTNLDEVFEETDPRSCNSDPSGTDAEEYATNPPVSNQSDEELDDANQEAKAQDEGDITTSEVDESERYSDVATKTTVWRYRVIGNPLAGFQFYESDDLYLRAMKAIVGLWKKIDSLMIASDIGEVAAEALAGGPDDNTPMPNFGDPRVNDPTPVNDPNMPDFDNWTQELIEGPTSSEWGPTNPFNNRSVRVISEPETEWDTQALPLNEVPPGLDFIPAGSSIIIIKKIERVRYETIP